MFGRRKFLTASAAATALTTQSLSSRAQDGANESKKVSVGVMGLQRGQSLALDLAKLPGVEVSYLCDVDPRRVSALKNVFADRNLSNPKGVSDFREILSDDSVDALVVAAPNHWHAPATIMACKAGKHVYVEKPCSHNGREGEWMVAAAQKFRRCVQMGTQRRSAPGTREAMQKLAGGAIGKLHLARCYYTNLRGSIGQGIEKNPPEGLDYELWQGPAPHVPYRDNVVHYNWHWFWHWGGGELANNGVHALDLCRWGLGVDYPTHVVSSGGRYWYDDDQETPDVQSASFEFEGERRITWDALSCNKHGVNSFCEFFGDAGALALEADGQYRIYDRADKLVDEGKQPAGGQVEHLTNFISAVRNDDPSLLNQPILEGHKSTLLCHLGNIAYRTQRNVSCNSSNGRVLEDTEQQALWQRDYEKSWESDVSMG